MKNKRRTYLGSILHAFGSVLGGMRLSGRHLRRGFRREPARGIQDKDYFGPNQGPITVEYPMTQIPLPDNGRYRLHMETEDCIACDKCARICPVDCITIESFRADGDLGKTSDGTVKRLHLPVFDIDMAKCMYCGLCTTVCPTECLTMTPVYDFSEFDRDNLLYHFGALSPEEEAITRKEAEAAIALKKAQKAAAQTTADTSGSIETAKSTEATPGFVPKRKPLIKREPIQEESSEGQSSGDKNTSDDKPAFTPRRKPVMKPAENSPVEETQETAATPEDKPAFTPRRKPIMQKPEVETPAENTADQPAEAEDKPAFVPRRKPIMQKPDQQESKESGENSPENEAKTTETPISPEDKPAFVPRRKPIMKRPENPENKENESD